MKTLELSTLALLAVGAAAAAGCSTSGGNSTSVPSAPTGVEATAGDAKVTLTWPPVGGATLYNLYWSTTAGVTQANGTKIAGATSPYVQTGLTNGTTYYYVLTAVNGSGESAASSQVNAVPSANAGPPGAPTGVQAVPGNAEVTISWPAVTGATSYDLYWSTSTGLTPANGTRVAGASSPYVQTGLTNGTTYYYVVTAVNADGESMASSQVSAVPSATASPPYIYALVLSLSGGGVPPYFGHLEAVYVCTDGYNCDHPVTSATVTVNGGGALTYDATSSAYFGDQAIAEGSSVSLQVTIGADVYTANATQFTSPPTVTAPPTSGAIWMAANSNTITWSGGAPTTEANYYVQIYDSSLDQVFPSSSSDSGELPITTTAAVVPQGSLPTGGVFLMVGIVSPGAILQDSGGISIPNAAAGSGLWLGLLASIVPITVE